MVLDVEQKVYKAQGQFHPGMKGTYTLPLAVGWLLSPRAINPILPGANISVAYNLGFKNSSEYDRGAIQQTDTRNMKTENPADDR